MNGVSPPGKIQFGDILRAEVEAINQRRAALGRAALSAENCASASGAVLDAVGLALSGGGIRSAALSLGVLQALNHHNAVRNIDYLSTVSGGGYIGCALTATMTCTRGEFVFGHTPSCGAEQAAAEIADTPAVGHLRNYSNYLIPAGLRDLGTGFAIVLRGLAANFAVVLGFVLMAAAYTIITNPTRSDLGCPDLFGFDLCAATEFAEFNFSLTLFTMIIGTAAFFLWALYRSLLAPDKLAEFRTRLPAVAFAYLCVVVAIFFIELQSFVLQGMFDLTEAEGEPDPFTWLTGVVKSLAAFAAPVAALVTFFRQQMGDILKAASAEANIGTRVMALLSKAAFWVAGAALPLLVWVLYLYLSYWGIINDLAPEADPATSRQQPVAAAVSKPPTGMNRHARDYSAEGGPSAEDLECILRPYQPRPEGAHTPAWMIAGATVLAENYFCRYLWPVFEPTRVTRWIFKWILYRPMVLAYGAIGFFILLLVPLLRPNANSLHNLYRDRLSKAFLFDPHPPDAAAKVGRNEASIDQGRDFAQLDDMRLSALSIRAAPYHLINAALNIQGSDYANRRGRNADFFLFSPRFVGSDATGYEATAVFEHVAVDLNVATAMAISGAAASSNMGSSSIRPLRPTLALLNVRLGYWLTNPRYAGIDRKMRRRRGPGRSSLFLWNEITGRLYENSNDVYLTDGGHIENLGVYELLRRRCKLIIVVDAEADLTVRFPSFITLQRYARIDFGYRIDMPWDEIRRTTCGWMGFGADDDARKPSAGPHAAIGCIDYGEGRTGHILYIKSSLSGDENDYIRDYARRYTLFPHETTGDQFFSEEQFEVYRALGFHIAHGVLSGRDDICVAGRSGPEKNRFDAPDNKDIGAVRASLLGGADAHAVGSSGRSASGPP